MTELIRYRDRQGSPMDMRTWARALEDHSLQRVAETTLPDGKWISTVWLGLDHQWGDGPPLIFETMVFPDKAHLNELECERYSTEVEAVAGHARMVEKWS